MKSETQKEVFDGLETKTVTEIFPGLTVEEMTSLFFDANALKEPPYKLYQLNGDGHRYYYRFNEKGEPVKYPSVTTMLHQVMPTSPYLIKWMLENGEEGSVEKRDLAAAYGTFMHAQFERLIINRVLDFEELPGILLQYMEQNNLPDKFYGENLTKIRKDLCAFAQFVKDWSVKPLAVEIALAHPEYHYAGMVDLPCVMTDPKTGETFPAIVDFKSGRKGFYESHEIQLHLYKMMWNANMLGMPIERVFNFAPKDWRGVKPTYTLKEQTDSINARKIPHLLSLAAIEDEKLDNTFTVISGKISLDDYQPSTFIESMSLAELIKSKSEKKDTEPVSGAFTPAESTKEPESRKVSEDAYNICNNYCNVKNCDFNLGEHGFKCTEARNMAALASNAPEEGIHTSEKKKANTSDFTANLLNNEIEL